MKKATKKPKKTKSTKKEPFHYVSGQYRFGQLFFRDTQLAPDGTKLMIVMGVIPVLDNMRVKGEHLYTTMISENEFGDLVLTAAPWAGIDKAKETKGRTSDGVFTLPIWRVG
jgi:hypothetical protein